MQRAFLDCAVWWSSIRVRIFGLMPGQAIFSLGVAWLAFPCLLPADEMPIPPEPPKVADILLPAGRDINSPAGLPVRMLFDQWMRDPAIMRGPDGVFYLTGTTNAPGAKVDAWVYNDGIYLWKSTDLVHWTSMGLIWSLDSDATWAREWKQIPGDAHWRRAVWAPSLCYIKGTYWIPYSMNYYQTGLLKSTTGKPEGPYRDVTNAPMTPDIDAALFADDDGAVYFMWAARTIARMKDDMTGLAEAPRQLQFTTNKWGEGSHLYKLNGHYLFTNAGVPHNDNPSLPVTYDVNAAVADSVYGPYSPLERAIPFAGHNTLFQDGDGNWWSTFFGTDPLAPWGCKPGVLPVTLSSADVVRPKVLVTPATWSYTTQDPGGTAWTGDAFNDQSWKKGQAGFGDPTVMASGELTVVNTPLADAKSLWLRTDFDLEGRSLRHTAFYLRNSGPVKIYLNGELAENLPDASPNYRTVDLKNPDLFRSGHNVIAVENEAMGTVPYLDLGIVNLLSP